jgi:predicted ester cyclase
MRTPVTRRAVLGAATLLPAVALAPQADAQPADTVHSRNKRLVAELLKGVFQDGDARALERACHPECRFEIYHPFNRCDGVDAAASRFFAPLRVAMPNLEFRPAFVLAGEYEGRALVSTWGHVMGTFDAPFLGIPPTNNLAYLSFGLNTIVRDGKIAKAYILLDLVDLMRQAGYYPLRQSPGTPERWPFPPPP